MHADFKYQLMVQNLMKTWFEIDHRCTPHSTQYAPNHFTAYCQCYIPDRVKMIELKCAFCIRRACWTDYIYIYIASMVAIYGPWSYGKVLCYEGLFYTHSHIRCTTRQCHDNLKNQSLPQRKQNTWPLQRSVFKYIWDLILFCSPAVLKDPEGQFSHHNHN